MTVIDRRSGDDRRQPRTAMGESQLVHPCGLHDDMPGIISELVTTGKWLARITKIYMWALGITVTTTCMLSINIMSRYSSDMANRDNIRAQIVAQLAAVSARVDVIEKALEYMRSSDEKLSEMLKIQVERLDRMRDTGETRNGRT